MRPSAFEGLLGPRALNRYVEIDSARAPLFRKIDARSISQKARKNLDSSA